MRAETITHAQTDAKLAGCAIAARLGNVNAIRIAADWLRDRDEHADAALLDVLAGEYEARLIQARQLRAMVSVPNPDTQPMASPKLSDVKYWLNHIGLPVQTFGISGGDRTFLIVAPTDGERPLETAEALRVYLNVSYPNARFLVWVENRAMTAAGRRAEEVLQSLEGRMRAAA